jgi:hypothetical protein
MIPRSLILSREVLRSWTATWHGIALNHLAVSVARTLRAVCYLS